MSKIKGYKAPCDLFGGSIKKGHVYNPGTNPNYFQPDGQPGKHYIPKEIASKWELALEEEKSKPVKKSRNTHPKKVPTVGIEGSNVRISVEAVEALIPNIQEDFSKIEEKIWESFEEECGLEDAEVFDGSPIRVQGLLKKRTESLHNFLIKFFTKWNEEKDTLWVDWQDGDPIGEGVQTEAGKKRSLGDIYMICKYYYPDCTLKEVIQELYEELPLYFETNEAQDIGFRSCICQQINKRVWWYEEGDDQGFKQPTKNDEYGHPVKWYRDNL